MPDIKVNCIVNCNIKLSEPTKEIFLSTPLAYNNTLAHAMRVTVYNDDGTEADLTGVGVTGVFLRADNQAVDPINGTIIVNASGVKNIAEIILPASCYIVPGRYTFTMNLTANGSTRTALWVEGHVKRNTSGTIIDPGTPVGNIEQAIGQANAAANAASTAADSANTAANAANNAATNANSAASRANTVAASVETDINGIKSAFAERANANYSGYAYAMTAVNFELGKWSETTGNANERTAWIKSGFLDNTKLYTITILGSTTRVEVLKYNLDGTYASDWAEYNSGAVTIQPSETYKYKLNLRTYPEADITDIQAFLDANATLYYGDLFSAIREDLTQTEQTVTEIGGDVSVIETTLYGESTDPIAFESGKWSESTGNANSNTNWVRTADFLAQGETIVFSIAEGAQAFLLEYSGAGVYSGNYTQYNAGSYRIALPSANKYKLNARNYPEAEITNVTTFIENYLEISYESTPGLVQKVEDITPPDSFWSVPDTVYALVGQSSRIYFNEIFTTTQPGFFELTVTGATYPEVIYTTEYISLAFAAAKTCTITISYQDMMRHEISAKTITVTAVATLATIPAKKYMFLGDSLTNEGTMASTFKMLMGDSATMYGTRTSKLTQHEGRPGWGVTHYCDNATYNGITNPFYNPTTGKFDFTYYMSNNPTFADVEVVNIFLGRNNGYQTNIISRLYNEIIASIHAYNSDIIITLMCAYNTATDNSGCGLTLQNTYRFIYNGKFYNQTFIDYFASKTSEKIFIVPQNLNFDNYFDYARSEQNATPYDSADKRVVFTDNVHPASSGYTAWANTLFANMQQILSA